jgi:hypothetical protein
MGRAKSGLIEDLSKLPWPVGIVFGVVGSSRFISNCRRVCILFSHLAPIAVLREQAGAAMQLSQIMSQHACKLPTYTLSAPKSLTHSPRLSVLRKMSAFSILRA